MPKYFPGITHSMVHTVSDVEDMAAMNQTVAVVVHCFGTDEDKFLPIRIKKMAGPTEGFTAEIPQSPIIHKAKKSSVPVLSGKPADEMKLSALVAFDRVKQQFGLKFGKKYRVLAKTIDDLSAPKEQAAS